MSYICPVCKKKYDSPPPAYSCFSKHDVVYVMLTRSDLQVLIRFLFTGDMSILTESLIDTILSYAQYNPKDKTA